ncbi:MAG: hypothetical protein NTX64_12990 [Elusimicrobia bacterium]|nr:hypothetical protein [Elusimicrobiota bacterium]
MAGQRSALSLFVGVVAAYACVWGLIAFDRSWRKPVRLDTLKSGYYHDEFVELRLRARDRELVRRWREGLAPKVAVFKDGALVTTIAAVQWLDLSFSPAHGAFVGRWPCPWNAPPGRYDLVLAGAEELGDRLKVSGFEILRRVPKPLPPGFVALTLETRGPLSSMRVTAPDGMEKGWRGLLDWAEYLEADAFWMLVGETPGGKPGELWRSENFQFLGAVAQECRKRRLALGVYAMDYLTTSHEALPRYEYALDVEEGRVFRTRAISLRDPKRPGDVAALLGQFKDIPGVEYLGLDYIRNALGGYELIDDFFAEMPGVHPPPEWSVYSRAERIVWFHHKKIMRKDAHFIDAWQWWRAHKVGAIVRRLRGTLGPDKALWAFTLTWEKGWQHGQDVVMMNDAGVDADALMLYEANVEQFEAILKDFNGYVRRPDGQLVVGDVVDAPLHQGSGPGEMRRRLDEAVDRVYADGRPPAGLFIHDAGRALWGRLGPATTKQWMDAARASIRHLRERTGGRGASALSAMRPRAAAAGGRGGPNVGRGGPDGF